MDPFSISASIAGLVSLADLVFRTATKYVKGVRGSRQEVSDLLDEVKSVSLLLHNLSLVAFELESDSATSETAAEQSNHVKPHHLHGCQKVLKRLETGLTDANTNLESKSSFTRIQRRLKWPFSSTETKEILQEIQRHNQTISLALAADSMSQLRKLLSRQEETSNRVKSLQVTAKQILDIETKIFLDEKRRRVLQLFSRVNPRSEFATVKKLRHPLTGLWLTEGPEFEEWYSTPNARIWITGIPGAGKSVIAGAVIQECLQRTKINPGTAVAYFFCNYRDPKSHESSNILASLASQLAQQNETAYKLLEEYYDDLRPEDNLSADPTAEELIEVICEMCTSYNQVYLIVDGLDECDKQVDATLRDLLALAMTQAHDLINIALLSRDELLIRHQVEDHFYCVEMEARTEDIQIYVASELEHRISLGRLRFRDIELKDHIMVRLVDGAKGMFRWVACQLDHICELPTDRARREALEKLPPTLPGTYERILMRLEESSEAVRNLVRRALQLIAVRDVEKLGFEEICEALSISDDSDTFHDDETVEKSEVLQWCGSLIRASHQDHVVEFAHYTVQEFLEDVCPTHPKLHNYAISDEKAYALLGSLCLRYLTLTNYDRAPEATQSEIQHIMKRKELHPLYEHAAVYWPYYIQRLSNGSRTPTHLNVLFRSEKTANFCSWAIEIIHQYFSKWSKNSHISSQHFEKGSEVAIEIIGALLRPDFTPLHMAAILGLSNLCAHLLEKGANVNLRSKFGTPLQCAIGSFTVFSDSESPSQFESIVKVKRRAEFISETARQTTAQLLVQAGAKAELRFTTPFRNSTVLSLALMSSRLKPHFEMVIYFLKAGIAVEEEDLETFRRSYGYISRETLDDLQRMFDGGRVFSELLSALGESGTASIVQSRLYSMTLRFMNEKRLDTHGISSEVLPAHDASEDEVGAFITSAIKRNDIPTLKMFLGSSRSEWVKHGGLDASDPDPNWTALHIAISAGSLDALDLLLSSGCDPNSQSEDGRTPVHFCCENEHEDALRTLLRYNASTIIQDKDLQTIWHRSAAANSTRILKVLIELDKNDKALQMVSGRHETPIGTALANEHGESTLFLLKYCNSAEFWKSGRSIYRAAAAIGFPEIIRKMIDIGIEVDGMDDITGNPLHFFHRNLNPESIKPLMELFPLHQRRQEDFRTPFELMLSQAMYRPDEGLHKDVYEMILSHASTHSTPHEVSILWSFIGSDIMPRVVIDYYDFIWLHDIISTLIQLGIPRLYEQEKKSSAILPFIFWAIDDIKPRVSAFTSGVPNPKYIVQWRWISEILLQMIKETTFLSTAAKEPVMVNLLLACLIHHDITLASLLLENGVDIHSRVDQVSPFEFACFPRVNVEEPMFQLLLRHSRADEMFRGNETLQGRGVVHFTAGSSAIGGSVSILKCLLRTGVDVNLLMAEPGVSPLLHHIYCNSLDTVEVLFNFGADPWATGGESFDAPLTAIVTGQSSLLPTIAAVCEDKGLTPVWARTWKASWHGKLFSGGNALHLAACFGELECLKFYLDGGLLSNVNVTDDDLETPMHYAARFGKAEVIKFLHAHGGNINATSRSGLTPLHLSTMLQQLDATQALVKLGSNHIPCSSGCVPLVYAYRTGNPDIISALESSDESARNSHSISNPRGLRAIADLFSTAIRNNDITACENVVALGCPIDVELTQPSGIHPLMRAISEHKSLEVVNWLLQKGATVSTTYEEGLFSTALEAALAQPIYNSLISTMTTQYFDEGGKFLNLPRSPLHTVVNHGNVTGLRELLNSCRQVHLLGETTILQENEIPMTSQHLKEILTAIVNQRDTSDGGNTPLHLAARRNDVHLVKVLLDNFANIEELDSYNNTPLHTATLNRSTEVAQLLLSYGACPDVFNIHARTPLMLACAHSTWETVKLLSEKSGRGVVAGYLDQTPLNYMLGVQANLPHCHPDVRIFNFLLDKGNHLHHRNLLGPSDVCHLLSSHSRVHLRSLLSTDARSIVTKQIEWSRPHLGGYSQPSSNLIAATRNFRLLRHYLTKDELQETSDLARPGNHNLFCTAACWGVVQAIQNLLAIGANIDQQCCEHGTPLMAAASCRKFETVKFLVRQGAQAMYEGNRLGASGIRVASCGWPIMNWLLVTRHTEQPKLANTISGEPTRNIANWSGGSTVEVPLKWEWRKRRDEAMLEYARRRQEIVSKLRGRVLFVK